MNRFQYRMRHRKNNDLFKVVFVLVVITIFSFVLFKGCKSIVGDLCQKICSASDMYEEAPENFENSSYMAEAVIEKMCTGPMHYLEVPYEVINGGTSPQYEEKPTESLNDTQKPTETINEGEIVIKPTEENNPSENIEETILAAAAKVYSLENLQNYDYVLKNFYVIPSHTELKEETLCLSEISQMDLTIVKNEALPQILIFHTHSQEAFADSDINGKTIVDAGNELTEKLQSVGYNVIHLTDEFDMMDGYLDRGTAYSYANGKIEEIIRENPSIEVVIDLHRDGVNDSMHLVTDIAGKKTAKIMLFNGISYTKNLGNIDYLPNPYLKENLAMTYKMNLIGKILYPDLIRCIYIEGYRYCLHHRGKSLLIELGAQTNTYEEIHNAIEPLADMIIRTISEK